MLRALKSLFTSSPLQEQAYAVYVKLVAQSRQPIFYRDWQVDDTLDGRFDVIIVHLFLLISRCEVEGHRPEVQTFIRNLSEAFFSDMDRSLREMGASDTGVGIKVKKMAQAFYGRLKSYKEALAVPDNAMLVQAVSRNVYREKPVAAEAMTALAAYIENNHRLLAAQSVDALMQGDIPFSR